MSNSTNKLKKLQNQLDQLKIEKSVISEKKKVLREVINDLLENNETDATKLVIDRLSSLSISEKEIDSKQDRLNLNIKKTKSTKSILQSHDENVQSNHTQTLEQTIQRNSISDEVDLIDFSKPI